VVLLLVCPSFVLLLVFILVWIWMELMDRLLFLLGRIYVEILSNSCRSGKRR